MSKPDALEQNLQLILKDRQTRGWQLEPPAPGTLTGMVDFGSNDTLSLSSSGLLREEFLKELGKHPDFILGGRASRWRGLFHDIEGVALQLLAEVNNG